MHAAHKQAMTSYKLIITQQTHNVIILNIENPLLIPLFKITSLQEIHLEKLFIQLQVAKGP
jgi:hypothetical protein